jgi:hypothetical protein
MLLNLDTLAVKNGNEGHIYSVCTIFILINLIDYILRMNNFWIDIGLKILNIGI